MSTTSATDLLRAVRSTARCGVLTDIDGTISRIAPHPEAATVEPEARDALARLATSLTLVGAVSGRSAEDARSLVGLDNLVYSGNHGMEIWRNGRLERSPLALRYSPVISDLLDSLQIPRTISGMFVENKSLTASIHFREVEDPEEAERKLAEEVQARADELGLRVTRGRMVIEVRPPVELSKGTSVVELIDEYELDGLIYLGDDVTDVDAFHALRERRQNRGGHFYGIGVKSDPTPEPVLKSADAFVHGVDGVVTFLNDGAIE